MPTSTAPARTLLLLRHAKAEKTSPHGDLGRALSARGVADATAAGGWLAQAGLHIDRVLCSPSARTRQTWAAAGDGGAEASEVEEDDRVYEASSDNLVDALRETPDSVGVLLLIGHSPGIPALVAELADPLTSDPAVLADARQRFPTSGLCRLSYDGEWGELGPGTAALVDFVVPRGER